MQCDIGNLGHDSATQTLVCTVISSIHAVLGATYLIIAIRCTYGDFNDDVELCGSQSVTQGGHLSFIQPLAIDAHVHF